MATVTFIWMRFVVLVFMALVGDKWFVDGLSEDEKQVLTEIAICIISGRHNTEVFTAHTAASKLETLSLTSTGTNQIESKSSSLVNSIVGDIDRNDLMSSGYKYTSDQTNLCAKDLISDGFGDGNAGYGYIPRETKSGALFELAAFESRINPPTIKLTNGKSLTYREYERLLYDAGIIELHQDFKTGITFRVESREAIEAKQILNLVEKIETQASSTTNIANVKDEIIKKSKYVVIKQKLKFGTGIAVGLSAVVNIKLLVSGEIMKYVTNVGNDAVLAACCTGAESALQEAGLSEIAPGASILVLGVIDAIKASQTGDWSRFGLNIALNTGTTAGAIGGAWVGLQVGALVGPLGSGIGSVVGGIVGGVGARFGLGFTPMAQMTAYEEKQKIQALANELNPQFEKYGARLDTSKDLKTIMESFENGEAPLIFSKEFVTAQAPTLADVEKLIGKKLIDQLAQQASKLVPDDILLNGLKQLKQSLGCD